MITFLSTPSARRATGQIRYSPTAGVYFYPRPPRGGRPSAGLVVPAVVFISIHALREEGDVCTHGSVSFSPIFLSTPSARRATSAVQGDNRPKIFLSTPSARRATTDVVKQRVDFFISIHALREEGDYHTFSILSRGFYFYPRPPRGGRRFLKKSFIGLCLISIHALREEGDDVRQASPLAVCLFLSTPSARRATAARSGRRPPDPFLSTPSARRATAKTETKSLFSYKLYNILHEFRRALIYNGSKNYPNHAKRLENPVRRCRKDAENSPFAPGRKTQNNSRPSCSKGG